MKKVLVLFYSSLLLSCNQQDTVDEQKAALQRAAEKKFEKVTRLLKEDCDSNVQRETYKKVQQLLKSK